MPFEAHIQVFSVSAEQAPLQQPHASLLLQQMLQCQMLLLILQRQVLLQMLQLVCKVEQVKGTQQAKHAAQQPMQSRPTVQHSRGHLQQDLRLFAGHCRDVDPRQ